MNPPLDGTNEMFSETPMTMSSGVCDDQLQDLPSGCKWLVTLASFRPLNRAVTFPNGLFMAYKGLLTTYLLGRSSKFSHDYFKVEL